jgi:hypothetical protein
MNWEKNRFVYLSTLLVSLTVQLKQVSPLAFSNIALSEIPVMYLVVLMVLQGAVYLLIITKIEGISFYSIVLVGVVLRLIMLFSTPMITVDYYRYMWDGAVLSNGVNPYLYSPSHVLERNAPSLLVELGSRPDSILTRVIFPELRTPYPIVAQLFFAFSSLIKPYSLTVWRVVLLCFDVITLALLVRLLDKLEYPRWSIAVYWLNPIILKEVINSGHMDILIIPFLLLAILSHLDGRDYASLIFLALSVAVKVWPVILLPVFIRPQKSNLKKAAPSFSFFAFLCLVFFYPMYLGGVDEGTGILAYMQDWKYNSSIFSIILKVSTSIILALGSSIDGWLLARLITGGAFLAWIFYVTFFVQDNTRSLYQCTLVISGLLLLTPTFFPWYYVWLVPFLVFHPVRPMMILSALLPLYYLRFLFFSLGKVKFFDNYLVWVQFIPIWGMIIGQWVLSRRNSNGYGGQLEA